MQDVIVPYKNTTEVDGEPQVGYGAFLAKKLPAGNYTGIVSHESDSDLFDLSQKIAPQITRKNMEVLQTPQGRLEKEVYEAVQILTGQVEFLDTVELEEFYRYL